MLSLYLSAEDRHFRDTGLLQLEVLYYSINVLNTRMAVDYCKFLALQSVIRVFQCGKSIIRFYSLLFCMLLFMYFVLENGSSHSLLAWNAFRFSVKLFVFCKSFLKFWCSIISVAIVVINLPFSL